MEQRELEIIVDGICKDYDEVYFAVMNRIIANTHLLTEDVPAEFYGDTPRSLGHLAIDTPDTIAHNPTVSS